MNVWPYAFLTSTQDKTGSRIQYPVAWFRVKKQRYQPDWRLHDLRHQYGRAVKEVILCICQQSKTGHPCQSQSSQKFRFQHTYRSISTALMKIQLLSGFTELHFKKFHIYFLVRNLKFVNYYCCCCCCCFCYTSHTTTCKSSFFISLSLSLFLSGCTFLHTPAKFLCKRMFEIS